MHQTAQEHRDAEPGAWTCQCGACQSVRFAEAVDAVRRKLAMVKIIICANCKARLRLNKAGAWQHATGGSSKVKGCPKILPVEVDAIRDHYGRIKRLP